MFFLNIRVYVYLMFVSGYLSFFLSFSLPVQDEDAVVIINKIDDVIDEGDIGLSGLEHQASGSLKNESEQAELSLMNPEEMGDYAEGDILITQYGRNGIRDQAARWPKGIIPYVINSEFNQDQSDKIMNAMADFQQLTCLSFVPYNGQQDYIVLTSANTGCWSSIGKIGGRQEVNLQAPVCVSTKGTALHELLHVIGFMHEQSRPDRDDHVRIYYNNIKAGSEINFKKADTKSSNDFGVSYDYNSVMHYSEYAFSKNSEKTIEPMVNGVTIGQREGLSKGDVEKINVMYSCSKEEPQVGWVGWILQSLFGDKKNEAL